MKHLITFATLLLSLNAHAQDRVAIVVGANAAAPGRTELRFAHRDAQSVAKVLTELAGFSEDNVHVLLDPNPAAVLALLDHEGQSLAGSGQETMVFFYYSGHADADSLYPSGKPLALNDLRKRLENPKVGVRLGIIDACRGGGWTGAKGLKPGKPFNFGATTGLTAEGSILIASSSGLEDAHESERLRGSFFTHHWNVGLRGAGDSDRNGKVTVNEAFAYAKAQTIRDTAIHTEEPQHPSFQYNLRGRHDLPLSTLAAGKTTLQVNQQTGPLQVIQLDSGLLVLEAPRGKQKIRLVVPPGRYLVRAERNGATYAREVEVRSGQSATVRETELELVGSEQLASKSMGPPSNLTLVDSDKPRSEWEISYLHTTPQYDYQIYPGEAELKNNVFYGGYLWRHGKHLASRFGIGYSKQNHFYKNGAGLFLSVGETLGFPLERLDRAIPFLSKSAIEPYVGANLMAIVDPTSDLSVLALAQANVGIRLYALRIQFGWSRPIYPSKKGPQPEHPSVFEISNPRYGPDIEFGFRFVNNFN